MEILRKWFGGGKKPRHERVNASLKKRGVPTYAEPLWSPDDAEVTLREPGQVAQRVFALWAVSLRGEGISTKEIWTEFLDRTMVEPWFTGEERRFLNQDTPDPTEAADLVWRLESMWVLVWALGHLPRLSWVDQMCDTRQLMEIVVPASTDSTFVNHAKLRSKSEILDARELAMRQHWAIRDAYLNQRQIPANLDWKNPTEMIPAAPSMAGRLVEERHHCLNWLIRFGNTDWDNVDTPT